MRATWLILVLMSTSVTAQAAPEERVDEEWLQKAKTTGKAAYEKYLAVASKVEVEYESYWVKRDGGGTSGAFSPLTDRVRCAYSGENSRLEQDRKWEETELRDFRVRCQNKNYQFQLRKDKEEAGYALASYKPGQSKDFLQDFSSVHLAAFQEFGRAFRAIEGEEKQTLKGIRWDDDKALLKITWEIVNRDWGSARNELWVDPQNDWRVMEFIGDSHTSSSHTTVSYGETVRGITFSSKYHTTTTYKGTGPNFPANFDIDARLKTIKLTDKTDSDFLLSSFGFPEPAEFPQQKPLPRYLWFLLAAGGFTLLTVLFRWLTPRVSMMRTALPLSCLLIAAGLTALAGYEAFWPENKTEVLFQIQDPERDLGSIPCETSEITFQVTNPNSRSHEILGVREGCQPTVCFLSKGFEGRRSVGAGQSMPFACQLDVRKPGPFEASVVLLVEDNGVREVPLIVRGVGVDRPEVHE